MVDAGVDAVGAGGMEKGQFVEALVGIAVAAQRCTSAGIAAIDLYLHHTFGVGRDRKEKLRKLENSTEECGSL